MKTTNKYLVPIKKSDIERIITTEAPAHTKNEKNGVIQDLSHAIDYLCNEGTQVYAALDGEVVEVDNSVKNNYNKFEFPSEKEFASKDLDGNFILLKHPNNEFSIYSHLKYGSLNFKKGDKVKTGEEIALTGNTGWSIKPHLHFMVFKFTKPFPAKDFQSLEVIFNKE